MTNTNLRSSRFLRIVTLLGLLVIVQGAHAELVAHFPLDNDGADVVSGFEGTVGDGVNFVSDGGLFDGAAEFEGFGGIQLEWEEALNPEDAFSVTAWVNPVDMTSWNSVITSRRHVADPAGDYITGYILYNSPEEQWDFWTGGGGAAGVVGSRYRALGRAGRMAASGNYLRWCDGYKDFVRQWRRRSGRLRSGLRTQPYLATFDCAGGDVGTDYFFVGLIDDLSIWNESLDQATIQLIMTEGVAAAAGGGQPGDFNQDGVLDEQDIDALTMEVLSGGTGAAFDVNQDGAVTDDDRLYWVDELKMTYMGDSNLDGEFSSADLVQVLSAGQYEDAIDGNSTWATGDWDGNADFNSSDFVTALAAGGYEIGPRAAVSAVPEPESFILMATMIGGLFCRLRRQAG